jgi:hypothetical protein
MQVFVYYNLHVANQFSKNINKYTNFPIQTLLVEIYLSYLLFVAHTELTLSRAVCLQGNDNKGSDDKNKINMVQHMSHKNNKENNSGKQHLHCKLWYAFTIA